MAKPSKSTTRRTHKICNACGAENPLNAKKCTSCNKTKFAPPWVLAKRPVNRQVSVEITAPNPKYGNTDPRLTLSKWWPGGNATFHIPNLGQWEKIDTIINQELGPVLGWKTTGELIKAIRDRRTKDGTTGNEIWELVEAHPDILKKLVGAIDPQKISSKEFENVVETFGEISDAFTNVNAGFREAFLGVVKKLPKQRQRALEDLRLLLEGWSLQVVTNVAQQVKARLDTIDLFEAQIQDEKTFEIIGDKSIHRILECAMWLIDERYWLLQSNKTLRKFIGDEMGRLDRKRYGAKRPDFVCGTIENKLILLELKRPSHILNIDDLNQLETYTVVAEDYKNFSSYEGYLVGAKDSEELKRRLKRCRGFRVLHYADIIEQTRIRYKDFLSATDAS